MAATQTYSASVTAVSAMAASLHRHARNTVCASCGARYSDRDLVDRNVRRAVTAEGIEYRRFDCRCGNGSTMAGVKAEPFVSKLSPPENHVSAFKAAAAALTPSEMAKARERASANGAPNASKGVSSAMRSDVIDRMTAIANRFGGAKASNATEFVRTLSSVCSSLTATMDAANDTIRELGLVCSEVACGNLAGSALDSKAITSDALTGTLATVAKALDSASMSIFGRHLAVSK